MAAAFSDEGLTADAKTAHVIGVGVAVGQPGARAGSVDCDACPKLLSFCKENRLDKDILPLFVHDHIDYSLLFDGLTKDDLTHLFRNEWKLSFIQIRRIENAMKKEDSSKQNSNDDINNNNNNNGSNNVDNNKVAALNLKISELEEQNALYLNKIDKLNDKIIDLKDELKQTKQAKERINTLYNESTQTVIKLEKEIKQLKTQLTNNNNNNSNNDSSNNSHDNNTNNTNNNNDNDEKYNIYSQINNNNNSDTWQCGMCSFKNVSHSTNCEMCQSGKPKNKNKSKQKEKEKQERERQELEKLRELEELQKMLNMEKEREERLKEEYRINKILHSKESNFACKCETRLLKLPAKYAYPSGNGVVCNVCADTVNGNNIVYHCPKMQSLSHLNGFDICQSCADKAIAKNERKERRERLLQQELNMSHDAQLLFLLNNLMKD